MTTGSYGALPPALGESTEVLKPHAVGVTFAGGAGGVASTANLNGTAVALGEARVRIGVVGGQEIGVSGFAGASLANTPDFLFGGAISYKAAPLEWLAFVLRAGVIGDVSVPVFSADLAVIVAPYTGKDGTQLFSGLRGGVGIPVASGVQASTESFNVPVGLSFHSGGDVRVIVEGGLIVAFSQEYVTDPPPTGTHHNSPWLGGYGAVAVQVILR
jgi:hypothetical protein